jgi:hypothetical protein
VIYGIADTTHVFKQPGNRCAGPGRLGSCRRNALPRRLSRRSSAATTLQTSVELSGAGRRTRASRSRSERRPAACRIQFIGRNGRLLKEATASPAVYPFAGGEGYVRAKVLESNGRVAWTQPVMR